MPKYNALVSVEYSEEFEYTNIEAASEDEAYSQAEKRAWKDSMGFPDSIHIDIEEVKSDDE